MNDVLVVGSGAGGVNAAWPLVQRGLSVALLDYGNLDSTYGSLIPRGGWTEARRSDENQHRYFLGQEFEGIPFGRVQVGAQLTPPGQFIQRDTAEVLPVDSTNFSVTESLARGGLAAGWGAGVFPFNDGDLAGTGLRHADLAPHYAAVCERIGVCGGNDDLLPFLGECPSMMPALDVDSGAERVLARYAKKRGPLQARGFHLGVTRLAVCSREHRGRGPNDYGDMEFWSDRDRSVYRPQWTLEELAAFGNFTSLSRRNVLTFEEDGEGVSVRARNVDTGEQEIHRARALVLAAGALGSTRIVLRSLGLYDTAVPLVCNPYTYVPVLNLGMLGVEPRDRRHSLAQLTAIYQPDPDAARIVQAQYYSYRSLLTFKLMKEAPIACRESMRLMRLLTPVFGILGIHHEDRPTGKKRAFLRRAAADESDRLEVDYRPDAEEEVRQWKEEKELLRSFRNLGCRPLKRVRPGNGSSIHYAGTLPMGAEDRPLTTDAAGKLHGTRAVHVADGAPFPIYPPRV